MGNARWHLVILMLTVSTASGGIKFGVIHSTQTVDVNHFQSGAQTISLAGARGEWESAQIVVAINGSVAETKIAVGDLKSENRRIPQTALQIRKVENVNGYADALVPCARVSLSSKPVVLWLTVKIPAETQPGIIHGSLKLRTANEVLEIPLNVKVYDFSMPISPSIPAVFGISEKELKAHYKITENSPEWPQLQDMWYRHLIQYRISPYFCTWLNGTMKHHSYACPWPIGSKECDEYLADPRLRAFSIGFHDANETVLKNRLEYLKSKGWLDRGYFYLYDEPTLIDQYAKIAAWAKLIHSIAPEARVLTTYHRGPKDGPFKNDLYAMPQVLGDSSQILCVSAWAHHGSEPNAARIKSGMLNGQRWWSYVCMGPGSPQPNLFLRLSGFQNRAVMHRAWKEQSEGFLYWSVNAFDVNSNTGHVGFRKDIPAGDGVLAYPGDMFGVKGVVSSIRLERWRDSMEDYEYLKAYADKFGREAALTLLKRVYTNPELFTRDHNEIESFRSYVISKLEGIIDH